MATLRIDQATPGAGTAGQSRHDLVPGEVITLTAVSPTGGGVTYTWELLDKVGSSATLSATSGASVTIGPNTSILQPSAFLIKLTANDAGVITTTIRICSVRTATAALRIPLFPENAPTTNRLDSNDPDASADNAYYADRAGTGVAGQNWRGWAEWAYELVLAVEAAGGASAVPYLPSSVWTCAPTVAVGDVVYATGTDDTCAVADSNAIATSRGVVGVVLSKPTAASAIVVQEGEADVYAPATFTPGTTYYLGSAGALTATAPNTTGHVIRRIGVARNDTTLVVSLGEPIIN